MKSFEERIKEKQRSREADEEALESGKITREELQHINGGQGIFRSSKLVRKQCETDT